MGFPLSNPAGAILNSTAITSTTIATPVTANAKGSWTDVIAATEFDASGLFLRPAGAVGADCRWMIDIALEVAGQQTIIIPDLYTEAFSVGQYGGRSYGYFPIAIPKGSKIRARAQTSVVGYDAYIQVFPVWSGFGDGEKHARCVALGVDAANTRGTSVDSGGTTNAWGSWSQLSAAIPFSSRWINLIHGSQGNNAQSEYGWNGQIGVGAAGAEVAVAEYRVTAGAAAATEGLIQPQIVQLPLNIAAGQRVSFRAKTATGTDATDRKFDVIAYAIG